MNEGRVDERVRCGAGSDECFRLADEECAICDPATGRRPSDPLTQRRRRRLAEELADAGVAVLAEHPLSDRLLAELDYARFPPVHEGTLSTYGAIVVSRELDPTELDASTICLDPRNTSILRYLADGRHSFVLHSPAGLQLLLLPSAHDQESALVDLRAALYDRQAVIVQRRNNGHVRLLVDDALSIWDGAHWWSKPYAAQFASAVLEARPNAPRVPLGTILDFCVHTMSPADAGATLIWALSGDQLSDVRGLSAARPPTPVPSLSFNGRAPRAAIRQLLSQVDGAAILNRRGELIAIGAHLQTSAASHAKLRLGTERGTRHASARRYSFDHADIVAFVVSRDGPITIFVDGEELASIRTRLDDPVSAD